MGGLEAGVRSLGWNLSAQAHPGSCVWLSLRWLHCWTQRGHSAAWKLFNLNEGVPFIALKPLHDSLIKFLLSNWNALGGCSITSACYYRKIIFSCNEKCRVTNWKAYNSSSKWGMKYIAKNTVLKNTGSKYFILVLIKSLNLKLSILNLHNNEINLMVPV